MSPRVLPDPRPAVLFGDFLNGLALTSVLFAALYAILRKLTQQNEEQT